MTLNNYSVQGTCVTCIPIDSQFTLTSERYWHRKSTCKISTPYITSHLEVIVNVYFLKKNIISPKINEAGLPFFCISTVQEIHLLTFKQKNMIENNFSPEQTYKLIICLKIHNTIYLHVLVCQTKEQRDKVIATCKSLFYLHTCFCWLTAGIINMH